MPTLLAASVAIVRRDDVLLIQRNRAPSEGLWTLPGGRLEPGETAEQCAIRELKEEMGLDVFALRPVRVLRHGQFELQVFGTQAYDGTITPDAAEVRAWRWVKPVQLMGLRTTPGLNDELAGAFRLFDRT
jgi:ADP-ribose pyrophosphatase YjhB (NUDIX family)